MSGVKRKLEVRTLDEVYYPAISIRHKDLVENPEIDAYHVLSEPKNTSEFDYALESKEIPVSVNLRETQVAEDLSEIQITNEASNPLVNVVENTIEAKPERRRVRKWFGRFGSVVVGVIAICAVALVGMRLAGFRTFTVMSGSMTPEYPVGSLIYVQPVDYHKLNVGDVISFVANDDKTVVTHRIAEIEIDRNDSNIWRFKTKGDANESADAKLVHYKNVLGTPVIMIPLIGYFAHNIQQPPGIYVALVVGTLLLAWTFLPGTLEERRKTARKSVA